MVALYVLIGAEKISSCAADADVTQAQDVCPRLKESFSAASLQMKADPDSEAPGDARFLVAVINMHLHKSNIFVR